MALTDKLTAIANAIRSKTGGSTSLTLEQMPTEIANIPTGSTDVPFGFGGVNAQLVDSNTVTFSLADTSFVVGTTAPSSATSIKASTSAYYTTPTIAFGDKDIIVVQSVTATPTHSSSASKKAYEQKFCNIYVSSFAKGRASATSTALTTRRSTNSSYSYILYYNTSGTSTIANTSYGLYATCTYPAFTSTTAASTTLKFSTPTLYARYSSTYESSANMKLITACTWEWKMRVYLVDSQTSPSASIQKEIFTELFA